MKGKIKHIIGMIRRMEATDVDVIFAEALKAKQKVHPDWEIYYFARKNGDNNACEVLLELVRNHELSE